jgi:hypothetical protein
METSTRPAATRANGKTKSFDKARAKRQTTITQAVAATISTPPRKPPATTLKPRVKNVVLPVDVIAHVDSRIAESFKRTGRGVSWSALAEVALRELVDRDDFDDILERYGARARRPDFLK